MSVYSGVAIRLTAAANASSGNTVRAEKRKASACRVRAWASSSMVRGRIVREAGEVGVLVDALMEGHVTHSSTVTVTHSRTLDA